MSVFISYSNKDSKFADKLAFELVKTGVKVWIDKWAMQVGDSLIEKIQTGLEDASFLLVVLSENSIDSPWCQKELNSGLIRELDEREVHVIPIVIDACKIPLFLKEKLYADFKADFDTGFKQLIKPLIKLVSKHIGRNKGDGFAMDYALNVNDKNGFLNVEIDMALQYEERPNSTILIQTYIEGNKAATERFRLQATAGLGTLMRDAVILNLTKIPAFSEKRILLRSEETDWFGGVVKDDKSDIAQKVDVRSRLTFYLPSVE